MRAKTRSEKKSGAGITIQLQLAGIIVFSASLVLASALATCAIFKIRESRSGHDIARFYTDIRPDGVVEAATTNTPPWGQLVLRDIDLQWPEEYVVYEAETNHVETWTFEGMSPTAVRTTMQSAGLAADQIEKALAPASLVYTNSTTVITPDSRLVFSLSPGPRAKLYAVLAQFNANGRMKFPFCFPETSFAAKVEKSGLRNSTLTKLKQALYPHGDQLCFSDLEPLLQDIPDESDRLKIVKALMHRSAVLMAIRIWPDTDIDKLVGYWAGPFGARQVDVRPLLESLKQETNGGVASIFYFLPPFARARLYTYPLPSQPGSPVMDCFWTTMNFFNEIPDNRFSDPQYTVNYLVAHFYRIGKPTMYGDRIFLLNKHGNAIHSAVYLADDIVFTKNGNNFEQPWMLMRLKDMLDEYSADGTPSMAIYRDNCR